MNAVQSLISMNQAAGPRESSYSTLAFLAAQSVPSHTAAKAVKPATAVRTRAERLPEVAPQAWRRPLLSSRNAALLQAVPQPRRVNPLI